LSRGCKIATRAPRGVVGGFRRERNGDEIAPFLEDAAHFPGGHSPEVCFPTCEAEVASVLAEGRTLLAVGVQSSLTGGATPRGEVVLSTARLNAVREWSAAGVSAGAGVVLRDLDAALAARDLYFPPIPTYDGASIGGVVSTNAAGAATFKHGATRAWVDALTVVLACGEVLDLERGEVFACRSDAGEGAFFEIEKLGGEVLRVPVPCVACPQVAKVSAGYRGGVDLDLIDLFIGAEGTLGVVTEARLRLVGPRPRFLVVLVPVAGDREALALTRELRDQARARAAVDSGGVDVAAVEYIDARSLEVLREDGVAERVGVTIPTSARALLLVQAELPADYDRARAYAELAAHAEAGRARAACGPVVRLCSILEAHGVLDVSVPALPEEDERRRALFALREAVPEGVNRRVREIQQRVGPAVSKSGGDVIVPFERLEEALARYRVLIEEAGLDAAIWGHISDGNLHPNVLARSVGEMDAARRVQLAIGEVAIALGGSPMAEHGTGRNPAKKALLRALHGAAGVASMRATKKALDPHWQLAPGVLFDAD